MTAHRTRQVTPPASVSNSWPTPPSGGLGRVLWTRKWIVCLAITVCLAGGIAYVSTATPLYRSTSRLYIERTGPRIICPEDGQVPQTLNYLHTQVELLQSTPILAAAMQTAGISTLQSLSNQENPGGYIRDHLTVRLGKRDELITVSFDCPNPDDSAKITNAVVDSFVAYHSKRKQGTAGEVLKILRKEKEIQSQELSQRLKALMDFRQQHSDILLEDEAGKNVIAENLANIAKEFTQAKLEAIEAKSVLEARRASNNASQQGLGTYTESSNGASEAVQYEAARVREQLKDLTLQLAEWKTTCTDSHPVIQTINTQIDTLKTHLAQLETKIEQSQIAYAQKSYQQATAKQKELKAFFDQNRERFLSLNQQLGQYALLRNDWEQTQKLVDILNQRIKELDISEEAGAMNINVLETARPTAKPASPQKFRTIAASLALGLLVGIALSLVMEGRDRHIRTSSEVADVLGIPVIGVVPLGPRRLGSACISQITVQTPNSPISEAIRNIRTAIYFSANRGKALSILVTSPRSGDGKTTIVSNLAISLAQTQHRTLIIDADFRKPMINQLFHAHDSRGLSAVLSGETSALKAVVPTKIPQLDVLPAGIIQPGVVPFESHTLEAALEELSKEYEFIVIDSPPTIPIADARILGAICDMTLLVLRANNIRRDLARHARNGLLSVNANLFGAIVNGVPAKSGQYGYYSPACSCQLQEKDNDYVGYKVTARTSQNQPQETAVSESDGTYISSDPPPEA